MTYGAAAMVLLVAAIGFGFTTLPASGTTWLVLIGLALGPQLLGHTSINYAMRHLSALLVTIALLGEPVGSAILAFVLFQEQVAPLQVIGLVALLLGIGVTAVGERTQ
jgi:drug/metabolite transporter (DMT)-like permease